LTQTFVESYVDFEVAHLSVLMVRRMPHPEIPTITDPCLHTIKNQLVGISSSNLLWNAWSQCFASPNYNRLFPPTCRSKEPVGCI